jgi:anti-sigma factor RsiW
VSAEAERERTMSADDARDRFGDAIDGTLGEADRQAFEAALAADAELREEYESYRAIVGGLSGAAPRVVGADAPPGETTDASAPDAAPPNAIVAPSLVPKVQDRIRKRSKGRFFRDRFSAGEARGGGLTLLLATATFLLLVAVWLLLQNVELVGSLSVP